MIRCALALISLVIPASGAAAKTEFRAGAAIREVNPLRPTVVIGPAPSPVFAEPYGDLRVQALAIEDAAGSRILILSADTLFLEASEADALKTRIQEATGLSADRILANASHTHSAPPLNLRMVDSAAKLDPEYVSMFMDRAVQAAEEAIAGLRPAILALAEDECAVAVNRRVTKEGRTTMAPNPEGSMDRSVQVLAFKDPETGSPFALLVKYACHPVTTSMIGVGADYPGFMREELVRGRPGLAVQFVQGCSGDCRPMMVNPEVTAFVPGSIELCRKFGRDLAAAVDRALSKKERTVAGPIGTAMTEIQLPVVPAGRKELEQFAAEKAWHLARWGKEGLAVLDRGERPPDHLMSRVQAFRIGSTASGPLFIAAFDGEVFSGYALSLARRLAPATVFALAYSNGMTGYVPTAEEMPKGGYETEAYRSWNTPGPFKPEVEALLLDTAAAMAAKAGEETVPR